MNIGVVAIGRNEGERLGVCLTSALRDCATVVYVDSGSSDASVNLAKSLGVHVVELDLSHPFTAARARNQGFARLLEIDPAIESVQFVDGDCEIVTGWITAAANQLQSDAKIAVVCGRRRERFPDATLYNKLCDMEWNTPIGLAKACGGDALIRANALEQVQGYDATVIAGEEPEMCVRLRSLGWTIYRIDAEMTLHDAAMTRFNQWWKRNIRSGHAYAQGNFMHGQPPELFRQREVRSIEKWVRIPIAMAVAAIFVLSVIWPRWTWTGLAPLLLYVMLVMKITSQRMSRGAVASDAMVYGISVVLGKFPQWIGVRRFRSAQRRGERSTIIEYKSSSVARGA